MRWVPPDSGGKQDQGQDDERGHRDGLDGQHGGASSSSTRRNRAERAASTVPAATPRRKPAVIRTRE